MEHYSEMTAHCTLSLFSCARFSYIVCSCDIKIVILGTESQSRTGEYFQLSTYVILYVIFIIPSLVR